MSNKLSTTRKKMSSLGLKRTESGDYEHIDLREKFHPKYKSISCKKNLVKTVEGKYNILVCEKKLDKHED